MKKISVKGPIVSNDAARIYDYFGWDAACPNKLRKGLEDAAGEDVVIEINSPGGVCVYGYEMYTMIREYEGKVTVHVISAMSAATLIACASDEVLISDAGIFMIHNARASAVGDYRDMQMEADALREFNAGIINAYVRKTGKSREEIQELMDKNSYMSPQTAIEHGFVDGYMFDEANAKKKEQENLATRVVASYAPVISEDKARELLSAIALAKGENPEVALVQQEKIGVNAVSNTLNMKTHKEGGTETMTLNEFLGTNPEAKTELDAMMAKERECGMTAERARMQSLDAIAGAVSAEVMQEAKYGENPTDGQTLAYQALCNGEKLAAAYMEAAKSDSTASGADEVGIGKPDVGGAMSDEADELAMHVNKKKGGN